MLIACRTLAFCQNETNNQVHTKNYVTSAWGQPGDVKVSGTGAKKVILLAGWGFDGHIFDNFREAHKNEFTMYTVTFPGFGKTHAPPMPDNAESYKDLYWTKGIIKGLVELIDQEKMDKPVVISCFTYSELIALRLALDYPDRIGKVIIISGMAKYTANNPSYEPRNIGQRTYYVENMLSKQWFRTVNTQTWNKGNFAPATFCKDTVKAKIYWKEMSSVPIPVMVRYLCEYYCTDISLEYQDLKVPTLVVLPSFSEKTLCENTYLAPFFHYSWMGAKTGSKQIQVVTITDSNAFIMDDQPSKLDGLIKEFLENGEKQLGFIR